MEIVKQLLVDAHGNYCFTAAQDNTSVAAAVTEQRNDTKGWTEDRTMKKMLSVQPYVYQYYADKFGSTEC